MHRFPGTCLSTLPSWQGPKRLPSALFALITDNLWLWLSWNERVWKLMIQGMRHIKQLKCHPTVFQVHVRNSSTAKNSPFLWALVSSQYLWKWCLYRYVPYFSGKKPCGWSREEQRTGKAVHVNKNIFPKSAPSCWSSTAREASVHASSAVPVLWMALRVLASQTKGKLFFQEIHLNFLVDDATWAIPKSKPSLFTWSFLKNLGSLVEGEIPSLSHWNPSCPKLWVCWGILNYKLKGGQHFFLSTAFLHTQT